MTKKIIFGIFIIVMLVLPIILVVILSNYEKEKYEPNEFYTLTDTSYGVPEKFERRNLSEYYIVSGEFSSGKSLSQDLSSSTSDEVRVIVSEGSEVCVGDIIGTVNGIVVKSEYNAIVRKISLDKSSYVVLDSTDEIVLSCKLPLDIELKKGVKYKNDKGEDVEVIFKSKQVDDSGRVYNLKVSSSNYSFGESSTMKIYTGKVYENALTISSRAVYKKAGDDSYYIRRVNIDGSVIGESKVVVGYEVDGYIGVSGAEESWYCDPAYSELVDVKEKE